MQIHATANGTHLFQTVIAGPGVENLQAGGNLLFVPYLFLSSGAKFSQADADSFVTRARLLLGRSIHSAHSSCDKLSNFDNALNGSLQTLPEAFAAGLTKHPVANSKAFFQHYAAHETLSLFSLHTKSLHKTAYFLSNGFYMYLKRQRFY